MGLITTKGKKSQAAMEFLMTYGWAILVVLAAIAALAYFGVLSPEKFLPEKCILAPGLACTSHKVGTDQTTLVIANSLGKTITVNSIQVGGCTQPFSSVMVSGNSSNFVIPCTNGVLKDTFNSEIVLGYTEGQSGLTKTVYGDIATKVE